MNGSVWRAQSAPQCTTPGSGMTEDWELTYSTSESSTYTFNQAIQLGISAEITEGMTVGPNDWTNKKRFQRFKNLHLHNGGHHHQDSHRQCQCLDRPTRSDGPRSPLWSQERSTKLIFRTLRLSGKCTSTVLRHTPPSQVFTREWRSAKSKLPTVRLRTSDSLSFQPNLGISKAL